MPDPTETMEVPPLEAGTEKKGRGPTRPEVKFADLVGALRGNVDVLDALKSGGTAKAYRESIKQERLSIKAAEKRIADAEATADYLARAEELPEHLRRALVATLETDPK